MVGWMASGSRVVVSDRVDGECGIRVVVSDRVDRW